MRVSIHEAMISLSAQRYVFYDGLGHSKLVSQHHMVLHSQHCMLLDGLVSLLIPILQFVEFLYPLTVQVMDQML